MSSITRRRFLQGVGVLSLPAPLLRLGAALGSVVPLSDGLFLRDEPGRPRRTTATAIVVRLVPTGEDPIADPGALEARAVDVIDLFLSSFELPTGVADGPLIYLRGRFSGRAPHPDNESGTPSGEFPNNEFLDEGSGQVRTLPIDTQQEIAWRIRLYGQAAAPEGVSDRWRAQLGKLIPVPPALRALYAEGLDAFDEYARQAFGRPFAELSPFEQDLLLESAGNPVLGTAPFPAPAATRRLFPHILVHTLQACYGLPEYSRATENPLWRSIGWDGDTQPLGSSIYGSVLANVGEGENEGYGAPGVYEPVGSYNEFRPVSTLEVGNAISPVEAVLLSDVVAKLVRDPQS